MPIQEIAAWHRGHLMTLDGIRQKDSKEQALAGNERAAMNE
jgi:hypothetical protein